MSAAAVNSYPVTTGSAARIVPGVVPAPGKRVRTPLSLVTAAPRKRRAPFVVMCFGLLAVALMAVLVLNISVSSAQYQLVQLRAQQSTLTKQNQDLTQQVQNFDAPQNLAAKATELGMVASTVKGQIDLSTLSVTGKAKPAAKGDAPGAIIAAPAVAGQLDVVPPPSAAEPLAARRPAEAAPATQNAAQTQTARNADLTAAAGQTAAGQAPKTPVTVPAAPPAPVLDLNGGSVPAPAQKVPGQ